MSETIQAGALYVVSTPIGNLDDITLRAVRILGGVDLIAAEDTRTTKILLDHVSVNKPLISYHSHNEVRRSTEIVEKLHRGGSVAIVTDAGTPGISDPAFSVIRKAVAEGIRIIPVPGASAALAALVVSGLPMDRFVFEGFLPLKKGRKKKLQALAAEERTVVLYESPHRIIRTLEEMCACFGNRPVAVARELTKKFEEVVRGALPDVLEQLKHTAARGEYVVIIGGNVRKEG